MPRVPLPEVVLPVDPLRCATAGTDNAMTTKQAMRAELVMMDAPKLSLPDGDSGLCGLIVRRFRSVRREIDVPIGFSMGQGADLPELNFDEQSENLQDADKRSC